MTILPICFSKVMRPNLFKLNCWRNTPARRYGIWEPDYLILSKTKTPEYDLVNFQIKGYDFAILENYQSKIHKIANLMAIDVKNAWATPHQDLKVQTFFPNSSKVENEYHLRLYERNVQIADAKSHMMALFIEAIITACPPGVKLNIHDHSSEIEENLYVPDYEIVELQKELSEIGTEKKKKKNFSR